MRSASLSLIDGISRAMFSTRLRLPASSARAKTGYGTTARLMQSIVARLSTA
jgi:hypothetical protein